MQIDIPPDLGAELVKALLQEKVPYKSKQEFKERPFETLIFNLFTQKLRDSIWNLCEKGGERLQLAKEQERNGLLMALLTMVVHKVGNEIVVSRDEDGAWYEDTGLKLRIEQNENNMRLTVVEDDKEEE